MIPLLYQRGTIGHTPSHMLQKKNRRACIKKSPAGCAGLQTCSSEKRAFRRAAAKRGPSDVQQRKEGHRTCSSEKSAAVGRFKKLCNLLPQLAASKSCVIYCRSRPLQKAIAIYDCEKAVPQSAVEKAVPQSAVARRVSPIQSTAAEIYRSRLS